MKELFLGIVILLVVGIAGFFYRNALEHPIQPMPGGNTACTMEAKICPDGTSVGRSGPSCEFAACPPPNVEIPDLSIAFALPAGYAQIESGSSTQPTARIYQKVGASAAAPQVITIKRYPLPAGKTAAEVMVANVVKSPSGLPAAPGDFTPVVIGGKTYQSIVVERFEGQVESAYFLVRAGDVLEFDIIERGVAGWTDPKLVPDNLPEHQALIKMLGTLQSP